MSSTNKHKHICHLCNQHFTRAKSLRDHERSHNGDKPYTCCLCSRAFTREYDKTMHEREVHEGLRPHRCRRQDASGLMYGCDAGFKRKRDLTRHLSRRARDACLTIPQEQHASPVSSMSIIIRHSRPEVDAKTTGQDVMIFEEPYRSPPRELSWLASTASSQSQSTLAKAIANSSIKSYQPSMYLLHDWNLVVLNLSKATVALSEALQYRPSSHHGPDLRSSQSLVLQCHQDLNRGAQALITHKDYGPLRLCVNALFVIAGCQQDIQQLRMHANIIDRLHEQYNKHPPPAGPSIGMWSFGGRHHLPLDHVQNWRSGTLDTQSALQWLQLDNDWFDLEYSWLSSNLGSS